MLHDTRAGAVCVLKNKKLACYRNQGRRCVCVCETQQSVGSAQRQNMMTSLSLPQLLHPLPTNTLLCGATWCSYAIPATTFSPHRHLATYSFSCECLSHPRPPAPAHLLRAEQSAALSLLLPSHWVPAPPSTPESWTGGSAACQCLGQPLSPS